MRASKRSVEDRGFNKVGAKAPAPTRRDALNKNFMARREDCEMSVDSMQCYDPSDCLDGDEVTTKYQLIVDDALSGTCFMTRCCRDSETRKARTFNGFRLWIVHSSNLSSSKELAETQTNMSVICGQGCCCSCCALSSKRSRSVVGDI